MIHLYLICVKQKCTYTHKPELHSNVTKKSSVPEDAPVAAFAQHPEDSTPRTKQRYDVSVTTTPHDSLWNTERVDESAKQTQPRTSISFGFVPRVIASSIPFKTAGIIGKHEHV
eukprot:3460988-Pyramimonas_sp.AAC.1